MDDAYAKKIKLRAAIHGAFDELQPVDIPFHGTVAPGLLQGGEYCCLITTEILGKCGQQTALGVLAPLWPSINIPFADNTTKFPCQRCEGSDLWRLAAQFFEIGSSIFWFFQQQPCCLSRRSARPLGR